MYDSIIIIISVNKMRLPNFFIHDVFEVKVNLCQVGTGKILSCYPAVGEVPESVFHTKTFFLTVKQQVIIKSVKKYIISMLMQFRCLVSSRHCF